MYGAAKALEVMEYKRKIGQVAEDKNCPGHTLYLLAREKTVSGHATKHRKVVEAAELPSGSQGPAAQAMQHPQPASIPGIQAPGTPAPSGPAPAGSQKDEHPPPPKKAKKEKVLPTTPLEKGRDLRDKALVKKGAAQKLRDQVATLAFGNDVAVKLDAQVAAFQCFACIYSFERAKLFLYWVGCGKPMTQAHA